jgi:hypothetical protein
MYLVYENIIHSFIQWILCLFFIVICKYQKRTSTYLELEWTLSLLLSKMYIYFIIHRRTGSVAVGIVDSSHINVF